MEDNTPLTTDLHTEGQTTRDAQGVDGTPPPPRLNFTVVGIGASAGGLEAFTEFFDAMPAGNGMAFVLVQHLSPKRESMIAEIVQKHTTMRVEQVEHDMPVEPNRVYVIRPGHTLTIKNGRLQLGESLLKPGHSRPVDDFFRSLAEEQRERSVCVILSGMGSNGTAGAQAIKVVGGMSVAQEPDSAKYPSMPRSLIESNLADFILKPREMPEILIRFARHSAAASQVPPELVARSESHQVGEILAILRARTRNDFAGYKKPTLVRRIQRRMGLTQHSSMADYARMLRQTPAEVVNLSDDLMIHVTGFFRDPEVWETLREKVILPLVSERQDRTAIRCWVTACASGEEAYTLAMLLTEAAEQLDKRFDIKVFATDMAERALGHARAGIYPGGIESEMSPARLARFFDKDESMYRIKKEVREIVVFAPQNVLQDPPFSRLDIVTCRNLLIYLEPDTQQRLLGLLHFGLREGGTLLLGNSETIGERDDLFATIDKKKRIYRRIGPTRHGLMEFPESRVLFRGVEPGEAGEARIPSRQSLPQVTSRALLDVFTPPAVVVDRDGRIVYFHGETELFLDQPRGEPTREVLVLARDFVRGSIRVALFRAIESGELATVKDGLMPDTGGEQARVEVAVMPLDRRGVPGYFLISFKRYPVQATASHDDALLGEADLSQGLRSMRDELQSAIEELQTSNEEMKASNEEVTSINEELQSTNEELETSKEELQSLNEELATVNAQLQAKMEELERTSNDLTSLLSSTDIAVIFLDTQFRIRRFTPAVRKLMDLIPSDVGRPIADMARKFVDDNLIEDARQVLETLVPTTAEIQSEDGHWYARRVLPYRTTDNRIEGVVVTFMDVTDRKLAEMQLAKSKAYAEDIVNTLHEPLIVLSNDLTVLSVNDTFYAHFKADPKQTIGRKIYGLGNGQWESARLRNLLEKVLPEQKRFSDYEITHEFETIGRRVMLLSGRQLDHAQQILIGIRDVTDSRNAELAVRRSEKGYRTLVSATSQRAYFISADWQELTQIDGETDDARPERDWLAKYVPSEELPRVLTAIEEAKRQKGSARLEHLYRRDDGTVGTAVSWVVPLWNARGEIVEWFGATSDIDKQNASRRELDDNKRQLRLLLEAIRDFAILQTDAAGVITHWNAGATELLGWTDAEAIGRPAAMIFTEEDQRAGKPKEEMRVALETGRAPDERWHRRRDDSRFWGSGVMSVIRDESGKPRGFVKVLRDTTDRRRVETQRAQLLDAEQYARSQAEAANDAKDQFLANASHELRTPLSAILLWSRVLGDPNTDPATLADGIAAIEHSARAQQKLIEDLLDSARIATGKMTLELKPVDLAKVVGGAVNTLRPAADAKGVRLSTESADDIGFVLADADRLQQVVWNVVSNAVKFTPDGGRVDVGLLRQDATVEIRVADTGVGIPADLLPELFTRFRQGDLSSTRRFGGLGLGLTISRQLIELHGGTIEARSEGPGRGSEFVVRLPLPRRAAGKKATRKVIDPGDLKGVRVVLIEDDTRTREGLAVLLERSGAEVEAFAHTGPAKAAILARPPDLLLSDIGLPDKDGNTLMRELRAEEKPGRRMPAMAFTAFDRPQDRADAIESGFDDYLTKPVDAVKLLAQLHGLLKR